MDDYIKREDAINAIKPIDGWWVDDEHFVVSYEAVLSIIRNLPPADVVERGRKAFTK